MEPPLPSAEDNGEALTPPAAAPRRSRPASLTGPPELCTHNGCAQTFAGPSGGRPAHIKCRSIHALNCQQPCAECARQRWTPVDASEAKEQCKWCNRWLLVGNKTDRDAARKHQKITCHLRPKDAPITSLVPVRECPHNGCNLRFSIDEMRGLPLHAACQYLHLLNCIPPCAECEQRGWVVTGKEEYTVCGWCRWRILKDPTGRHHYDTLHKERCIKRPGAPPRLVGVEDFVPLKALSVLSFRRTPDSPALGVRKKRTEREGLRSKFPSREALSEEVTVQSEEEEAAAAAGKPVRKARLAAEAVIEEMRAAKPALAKQSDRQSPTVYVPGNILLGLASEMQYDGATEGADVEPNATVLPPSSVAPLIPPSSSITSSPSPTFERKSQ